MNTGRVVGIRQRLGNDVKCIPKTMEIVLLWRISVLSVCLVYFQHILSGWKLEFEPFYMGTKQGWIESRPSLQFNYKGELVGMRKCPALYLETECPVDYLQKQWEDGLVYTAWWGVIIICLIITILLMGENQ